MKRFFREVDGQDLIEYSMMLAFIALSVVAALATLQDYMNTVWTTIGAKLTNTNTQAAGSN